MKKKMKSPLKCEVCGKSRPKCDRAVYLAHGNGGAHGVAPAHKKCVEAFGDQVQGWNEDPGWYVRGKTPTLTEYRHADSSLQQSRPKKKKLPPKSAWDDAAALIRVRKVIAKRAGNVLLTGLKCLDVEALCRLAEARLDALRLTEERPDEFTDDCSECDGKGWVALHCNECGVELNEKNAPNAEEYRGDVCDKCELINRIAGQDRHGNPVPR